MKSQIFLGLFFFPFFIIDMYRNELSEWISFIPADIYYVSFYYLFWSVIIAIAHYKYDLNSILHFSENLDVDALLDNYSVSKREKEIVSFIMLGRTGREIGEELFISESTVKKHLQSIYKKLDIKSKFELINILNKT